MELKLFTLSKEFDGQEVYLSQVNPDVEPIHIKFSDDTKDMLLDQKHLVAELQHLLQIKYGVDTNLVEVSVE